MARIGDLMAVRGTGDEAPPAAPEERRWLGVAAVLLLVAMITLLQLGPQGRPPDAAIVELQPEVVMRGPRSDDVSIVPARSGVYRFRLLLEQGMRAPFEITLQEVTAGGDRRRRRLSRFEVVSGGVELVVAPHRLRRGRRYRLEVLPANRQIPLGFEFFIDPS